jgi:hypothetical protein
MAHLAESDGGTEMTNSTALATNALSGQRRTRRCKPGGYVWAATAVVAFGLGVAAVDGAASASADTGSSSTSSAGDASSQKHTAGSARKASSRPSSQLTSTGGATTTESGSSSTSGTASKRSAVSARTVRTERAADSASASPLQSLVKQLQYIFFNKTPTVQVGSQTQNADGSVTGTLTGQSNNGYALTYSVGRQPEYGTVVVDATTGTYTYTPNGTAPSTDVVDGFSIIANNGTDARLPGLLGVAQSLLHALAVGLGVSSKDTAESDIVISLTGQTVIGDPTSKVDYWEAENAQTAALTSMAMVIGQLTGSMPTLDALKIRAMKTLSVRRTTTDPQTGASTGQARAMYLGGTDWVWSVDTNQLLSTSGFIVTGSYYAKDGGVNDALDNIANALEAGKSVIVRQKSDTLDVRDNKVYKKTHEVTVLGIDFTNQRVYINDGGLPDGGQNLTMSLVDFIAAWGSTSYETIVVELAPTDTTDV